MIDKVPYKWQGFGEQELDALHRVLSEYCDRYEDTCEAEEDLLCEIEDEQEARRRLR